MRRNSKAIQKDKWACSIIGRKDQMDSYLEMMKIHGLPVKKGMEPL